MSSYNHNTKVVNLQKLISKAAEAGDDINLKKCLNRNMQLLYQEPAESFTALHIASLNGHAECVKILIHHQYNVNQENKDGWTSLHFANRNGHVECVQTLIANQANVNTANKDGWTALHLASRNGHAECVKILITHAANVNQEKNDGVTALHLASYYGREECLKILIIHAANVNQEDKEGRTALHYSGQKGHAECLKILIDHGANVNKKTKDGGIALHFSSLKGHATCVQLLIDNHTNVNTRTLGVGETALHLACYNGHVECIKILIYYKAEVNIKTQNGKKPMDIAKERNFPAIVEILEKAEVCEVESSDASLIHYRNKEQNHLACNFQNERIISKYMYGDMPLKEYYSKCYNGKKGICLIISNETFSGTDLEDREGGARDREKLVTLFTDVLRYDVVVKLNCGGREMFDAIYDLSRSDHEKFDSVVIWFLSHGMRGSIYGSDGISQDLQDMMALLKPVNCPSLKGKPKLIFLQACRGIKRNVNKQLKKDNDKRNSFLPNDIDFLFCYATADKHVAYRTPQGSPFVRVVCYYLKKYGTSESLLDVMTKVAAEVAENKSLLPPTDSGIQYLSQTVECVTHLRKLFRF